MTVSEQNRGMWEQNASTEKKDLPGRKLLLLLLFSHIN